MSKILMSIDNLIEGTVVKRPSKMIKSPYVADISIPITSFDNNINENKEILGHTASLGCCGLADTGATILMTKIKQKAKDDEKIKCEYRVYLSCFIDEERNQETIVGIHPKLAEDLTEQALNKNYLSKLQNVKAYKRETALYVEGKVDSRFDFSGIDENGIPFIMEVKNVPLADYEDITAVERKKRNYQGRGFGTKVAYFPDGYRKKRSDPVSPRALKHVKELTQIKCDSTIDKPIRCILCFVIQRDDVERFQTCSFDPEYKEAVKIGKDNGVEIIAMVVKWDKNGYATFIRDDLPICF
jgi:DNA-binding sugar fermentation-stimulating protein